MATFRIQEHVPDVYPRKSRDFQLFSNVFDCLNGGLKYDIDSIKDIVDTNQCNERLIPYLQTKLGFFTKVKIPTSHLRTILKAFPYIVRNKGSLTGIEQAVQVFLKVEKINPKVEIRVDNTTYTVYIGTQEKLSNTDILEAILRYVLPAGYGLEFVFYADTDYNTPIAYGDSVNVVQVKSGLNSGLRISGVEKYPKIISNVDTANVANNDSVRDTISANNPNDSNPEITDGKFTDKDQYIVRNFGYERENLWEPQQ